VRGSVSPQATVEAKFTPGVLLSASFLPPGRDLFFSYVYSQDFAYSQDFFIDRLQDQFRIK
jgi:hypothetical protein